LVAYGVARPIPPPHRRELAVDVPIALAWIGVAAFLVSRTLGRPLEKIAAAARAFGSGQMSVRTGVVRRDEIGDVARAFDEMSERIAELLRAQTELLASVSHELRTPLSRIRVALDLAAEGDAETARASLLDVTEDLTEIENLITDIFSAARLEMAALGGTADAVPLKRSTVEVCALVEKAVARIRGRFPDRTFIVDIDPACAAGRIHVDPMLVRRAFENVLENAQKYSLQGEPIRTAVTRGPGTFVIRVVDRGFGIGPGDLARVFSPFFRADRSRTRTTGGVGMGLALAKRVIEAHGGTIDLASQLDVGTTVTFTLPSSSNRTTASGPDSHIS
jgi:signal transduction histidine kinase